MLQFIVISHLHTWLLLTHNESLCAHQPAEMMNATLFSRHWLSGGETKCHFVPPQHSSPNRHRRTPISPRPVLTLPWSPLTHPLPSDSTCAPLQNTTALIWAHVDTTFRSRITCMCLRGPIKFLTSSRISRGVYSAILLYTCTHTLSHTQLGPHCIWHLTPSNALDPQWQQAGGTATLS